MEKEKHSEAFETSEETITSKNLTLYNDDHNEFDFVIDSLVEVCHHTHEQAEQCTLVAHFKGKCAVRSGTFTELEAMNTALHDRGLTSSIE